jgi:OmpA-OmpF porin, OOP family
MRYNKMSIAIGAALGLVCSVAIAQQQPVERGFYGGLSLGQSMVKFSDSFLPIGGASSTSLSKDETDTAWKAFAGYRIHRNIAVEGGYTDFGKFSATRTVTSPPGAGSASETLKVHGWHVEAVGILPLHNFDLFAKAGAMYATAEASKSVSGGVVFTQGANRNPSKSAFTFLGGIGAGYNFTKNLSVRLELEAVSKVGDGTTGEGSVAMYSVGGVYKF